MEKNLLHRKMGKRLQRVFRRRRSVQLVRREGEKAKTS